jgi:hypothetical protein
MKLRQVSGIVLLGASLVSVFALAHHPTLRGGAPVMEQVAEQAMMDRVVHGAMIVVVAAWAFGWVELCAWLGAGRAAVRAGAIAAALGVVTLVCAAAVDGFAIPVLAERVAGADGVAALRMCGALVVACSAVGTTALAAAMVAWSVAMARGARGVAVAGVVVAAAPVVLLAGGVVALDAHGIVVMALCQLVWNAAAGIALIRAARDSALQSPP